MFRIDNSTNSAVLVSPQPAGPNPNGYFTEGDPVSGVPATVVSAEWLNTVQEEICNAIVNSGIALNKASRNQLYAAIDAIVGNHIFPLAPQFDADSSVATTQFVQRALGNLAGVGVISGAYTLAAADCGKGIRMGNGGYTVTLPLISAVPAGASILLKNTGTGVITISRQGTDTISVKGDSITSFAMGVGDSALMMRSGVDWTIMTGSAELIKSAVFGSLLSSAGYQNLPSGLIIQWGQFTGHATIGNPTAVTFPITFPTACDIVVPSAMNASTTNSAAWYDTPTTTGFNGRCAVSSLACQFISIGR